MSPGSGAPAGEGAQASDPSGLIRQYRAARQGAILADRSDLGRLAVRGKDALDLLHRLTTNSIKTLQPGEGTAAVFATAKGRILDLVSFLLLEDHLLCLTGPGRAAAIRDWIERYTFREEVQVEDLQASHGTLWIFGAGAARLVAARWGEERARRPLHYGSPVGPEGAGAVLARTWPLAGEGFHLSAERGALPGLRERLAQGGDAPVPAGEECLEVLRIEAGLPAAWRELTEEYNPWEARLDDAISLTKGCYVGQEVIARLNTYKKVSKLLVRIALEGERAPAVPAALWRERESIGTLTSAARVPGEARIVGLGYVRDELAIEGRELRVAPDQGPELEGVVLGIAR